LDDVYSLVKKRVLRKMRLTEKTLNPVRARLMRLTFNETVKLMDEIDESTNTDEFDVNRYFRYQRKKILRDLTDALLASMDTGDYYIIGELIEKAIRELKPPKCHCERCGREMEWIEYHIKQGLCDDCIYEIMSEYENEV